MDPISTASAVCNSKLQQVLKNFKSSAEASLRGPSRYMSWGQIESVYDPEKHAQQSLQELRKSLMTATIVKSECENMSVNESTTMPVNSGFLPHPLGPLLMAMDSQGKKSETTLEGAIISCFIVGGEKRLCLPQLMNRVLPNFSLAQINTVCDELHIHCTRCNRAQLELLKVTQILPPSAPSCGLITKTDAERLCNALLHGSPEKNQEPQSPNSLKIYHECFGKCKGVFNPELYTEPDSLCVTCCHCRGMFPPQKFVVHSHKSLENLTCHWGFDSANWRAYILLAKDQDGMDHLQRALDDMKDKFDTISGCKKRREHTKGGEEGESKRARYNDLKDDGETTTSWADLARGSSAFRPWTPTLAQLLKEGKISNIISGSSGLNESLSRLLPPYLQTGPPILLNPERVVPFNDTTRYDQHFAPNVSLAPPVKEECSEYDEYDSVEKCDIKMSSSSGLSSPSPHVIKMERNQELDLSSSDESSFRSESMPSTPREDYRIITNGLPTEQDVTNDRNKLFNLVRQVFEQGGEIAGDDKERILEQVADVCARQEDRVHLLLQNRKHLLDLEKCRISKRETLQDMSESRRILRSQLDQSQLHYEKQVCAAAADRQTLLDEIEQQKEARATDIARVKAKMKGQMDLLRSRNSQYEQLNTTMATEINLLRQQLKLLGAETHDNHHGTKRQNGSFHAKSIDDDITMETVTADKNKQTEGDSNNLSPHYMRDAADISPPTVLSPHKQIIDT